MKKVLFLSLAMLVAGVSFADKKCCKDKKGAGCSKEAKASCHKDGQKEEKAEAAATPACCKKSMAQGKAACCKKDEKHADSRQPVAAPTDKK
ncbi:MAG: hypothetical protein JNM95_05590 [Chitinophagaceae bacterium]|nr:hypothetical protein [Chitinophagaceae bacterium]